MPVQKMEEVDRKAAALDQQASKFQKSSAQVKNKMCADVSQLARLLDSFCARKLIRCVCRCCRMLRTTA